MYTAFTWIGLLATFDRPSDQPNLSTNVIQPPLPKWNSPS